MPTVSYFSVSRLVGDWPIQRRNPTSIGMAKFLRLLDNELRPWASRLYRDIGLDLHVSQTIATTVYEEVRRLDRSSLVLHSYVSSARRLQMFEDSFISQRFERRGSGAYPQERERNTLTEMMALPQLYVAFVYSTDELFLSARGDSSGGLRQQKALQAHHQQRQHEASPKCGCVRSLGFRGGRWNRLLGWPTGVFEAIYPISRLT